MSNFGWIATIFGALVGTTLFEVVFYLIFGVKRTKIRPSEDPAYQSRIRWWEWVRKWL